MYGNSRRSVCRRDFVIFSATAALAVAAPQPETPRPVSADQALRDLLDGNHRFTLGKPLTPRRSPKDFQQLAQAQFPEAVVVSCADSRVAPEILFDVGI